MSDYSHDRPELTSGHDGDFADWLDLFARSVPWSLYRGAGTWNLYGAVVAPLETEARDTASNSD